MAEFCPSCPDRGSCVGEIEGVRIVSSQTMGEVHNDARGSVAVLSMERGIPQGPTALAVIYNDLENGRSNVIMHTGASYKAAFKSATTYHEKVEACEGPVTKRRFLGLLKTMKCGITEQ